jgi:hypothetical protein
MSDIISTCTSEAPEFTLGGLSGVRLAWTLVFCVLFLDHCLSLCPLGHCIVCASSIYGFWLPLWYLQSFRSSNTESDLLYGIRNFSCMTCESCANIFWFFFLEASTVDNLFYQINIVCPSVCSSLLVAQTSSVLWWLACSPFGSSEWLYNW